MKGKGGMTMRWKGGGGEGIRRRKEGVGDVERDGVRTEKWEGEIRREDGGKGRKKNVLFKCTPLEENIRG